jgi:hypothetical protein
VIRRGVSRAGDLLELPQQNKDGGATCEVTPDFPKAARELRLGAAISNHRDATFRAIDESRVGERRFDALPHGLPAAGDALDLLDDATGLVNPVEAGVVCRLELDRSSRACPA